jgi:hypothetical protein
MINKNMRFKEWFCFNEMSYTQEDIPKWFFVGIRWEPEQLVHMKLAGLKGIVGGDFNIATAAHQGPVLVLDGPQTEKINKLSKVLYEPEYMASKGFQASRRMRKWETPASVAQLLIPVVMPSLKATIKINDIYGKIAPKFEEPIKKLNTFLGKLWRELQPYKQHFDENIKTWEDFKNKTMEFLTERAKKYEEESEWIVKDKTLNIPQNTILFLSVKDILGEPPADFMKFDKAAETYFNQFEEYINKLKNNYQLYLFENRLHLYKAVERLAKGMGFEHESTPWATIKQTWSPPYPSWYQPTSAAQEILGSPF